MVESPPNINDTQFWNILQRIALLPSIRLEFDSVKYFRMRLEVDVTLHGILDDCLREREMEGGWKGRRDGRMVERERERVCARLLQSKTKRRQYSDILIELFMSFMSAC